jgi:acetoin utilization deacetylase AcuC-like enzyme
MLEPRVVWSPRYEVDIGPHVFPTLKYRLVRERLLERGTISPEAFLSPEAADDATLLLVHTPDYLRKIADDALTSLERARLEVPFSRDLADAMRLCCGGTVLTSRQALEDGIAVHLGGGFHHAFAGHGEGFCLLNDIAVGAAAVLAEVPTRRVTIVDLDVHQGNGTAAIFEREERVTTFSMHQENNYPAMKPSSDLDVGLPDGIGDEGYLDILRDALPEVLDPPPDLVLYLAGADPYREDVLGGLDLSLEGLRERDRTVFEAARAVGAGVAVTLAGGYALDTDDTISIHVATVEEGVDAIRMRASGRSRSGHQDHREA